MQRLVAKMAIELKFLDAKRKIWSKMRVPLIFPGLVHARRVGLEGHRPIYNRLSHGRTHVRTA